MPRKARLGKVTYAKQTMDLHGEKLWIDFPKAFGSPTTGLVCYGEIFGDHYPTGNGKGSPGFG